MYVIDRNNNKIDKLDQCTFSQLGFREREHLQEWIAKCPSVFGEDLLILQKEFAGFGDTNERLDLLAVDKQGDLVIIENKLDDTGRDVTWQALKYASYCSGLTKEDIRTMYQAYLDKTEPGTSAVTKLSEFFDDAEYEELSLNSGLTQRVIMVAGKFRKEVTSTVLWLLNYNVRLQCFRVTPYSKNDELFLNVEQIIPTKDAEDFMIGMAEKAQDDLVSKSQVKQTHIIRKEFWGQLLQEINARSSLYQNISPSTSSWISAGSGVGGIGFNFAVTRTYGRAEVYIDRGDGDENNYIFSALRAERASIEQSFGGSLEWEPLDGKRGCRIKSQLDANVFVKDEWPKMIEFMVDGMIRMERSFRGPLEEVGKTIKSGSYAASPAP